MAKAPTPRAAPLMVWVTSRQLRASRCCSTRQQLAHHLAHLAVEQLQDLGVQGLVAAGVAGEMGQIDGRVGHGGYPEIGTPILPRPG